MISLSIRDHRIAVWLTGGKQRLNMTEMFMEHLQVNSGGAMYYWRADPDAWRAK
jgi:hypothetical protein